MEELDKKIGTKDKQMLTAGSVLVKDIVLTPKPTKKGGEIKLVELICKHPEKDDLKISNVKVKIVQGNNETIKKDTLWYTLDSDGNVANYSTLGKFLKFYKKDCLNALKDSYIETETDSAGYLCAKAY
jgi:hypothetical protein